jgi:hypothetical protein
MPAAVRTSMRVPELTAYAAIKLNRRLSLRHLFSALLIRTVQFLASGHVMAKPFGEHTALALLFAWRYRLKAFYHERRGALRQ